MSSLSWESADIKTGLVVFTFRESVKQQLEDAIKFEMEVSDGLSEAEE